MSPEKLNALNSWRGNDLFSEKKCVALEYAEAMTFTGRTVDDELFKRVKIHFDEEATFELTGLIAFQNMSNKFNSALDIQPQGFCALPDGRSKTTISTESPP